MTMKTIIVSKLKALAWLPLLVAGLIIAPNAYMMPEEICVRNTSVIHSTHVRLRARLVYINENREHQQNGDISGDYIKLSTKATECMQTSQLVKLFRDKGLGDNDYYFHKVRADVKARPDCQLSGAEAVHSWIAAPRVGTVNFKSAWHSCKGE